jgi:hypothetical protein
VAVVAAVERTFCDCDVGDAIDCSVEDGSRAKRISSVLRAGLCMYTRSSITKAYITLSSTHLNPHADSDASEQQRSVHVKFQIHSEMCSMGGTQLDSELTQRGVSTSP